MLSGLLSERSEFTGPPRPRVPQSSREATDDSGSGAAPNACAPMHRNARVPALTITSSEHRKVHINTMSYCSCEYTDSTCIDTGLPTKSDSIAND